MRLKTTLLRIGWLFGVIAMIIGIFDPLEGSVLIVAGSILLAVTSYLKNDPQWKIFAIASLMIITGVSFLFYISSLGGFGGDSGRSWWWGALLFPYPAGWLLAIIMLIMRLIRR